MKSFSAFLISGANTLQTGSALPVDGMDNLSFGIQATGVSNLVIGSVRLQARLDPTAQWVNLYNNTLNYNSTTSFSGILTTAIGPIESVRAVINPTSGVFDVVCRYSANK